MVSGSFRKQHDFSSGFISQAQHGPIQIDQVEEYFLSSFSSLWLLLDTALISF